MKKVKTDLDGTKLRQKAEELLKRNSKENAKPISESEVLKLVHELQVHQVELELQNKELIEAKEAAQIATEKYVELYDFALFGFFTLSKEGEILSLNLNGAKMLGKTRSELVDRRFVLFTSDDSKPIFNSFCEKIISSKVKQSCEVEILNNISSNTHVHLSGIITKNEDHFFVMALDITSHKHAEIEIIKSKEKAEENEIKFKMLNRLTSEMLLLQDMECIYKFIAKNLQKQYPNSLVLKVSIDESIKETRLEAISGLDNNLLMKVIKITGFNPIGKMYKLTDIHNSYFKSGNFIEFKGGLAEFSATEFPTIAATAIEKMLGLHKIYTIGINKDDELLGAIHFFMFNKQIINDGNFIEIFVKQAGLVIQKKNNEKALINAKEKAEESEFNQRMQKQEIELNNKRLESLLKISQFQTNSAQELLDLALNEAISLTNSKIGYIYFYNENTKQFSLNTWSKDVKKECEIMDPQTIYDLDTTGCWGEAVRQRKPIVINNYQAENPLKKGTPHGYVKLLKFLTIPVIFDGKIVAVAGVANKATDYNDSDIRQLTLLMDNVWKITERIFLVENLKNAKEETELVKLAEQTLKISETQLKELNATKDKLFSIIAHDLRSPFNSILGFSKLLSINVNENDIEESKRYSNIINSTAQNSLNLLENLLNWAKSQTGKLNIKSEKMMLSKVILEVIALDDLLAKTKSISLNYTPSDEFETYSDGNMLKTVLRNLITNAIKFTKPGGDINISTTSTQDHIEISVSDNGVGMSEETCKKLFDISTNTTSPGTANEKGSGLGLVLCKEFVEKLGGNIWVESEVGVGSQFYFTIPYKTKMNAKNT